MKLSIATTLAACAFISTPVHSFAPQSNNVNAVRVTSSSAVFSTMADSGVPASTSSATDMEDALIPTKLPSDCGMDYVPLATMLASGQLAEADQVRLTDCLPDSILILISISPTTCLMNDMTTLI